MVFVIEMAAQGAICRPLLPKASSTSSHALKTHPSNARAAFFGISRPFCSHKHRLHKQRWSASIVRNGLFDFLTPGGSAGASDELVSEILDAARGTNGGSKASKGTCEEIEELVWSRVSDHLLCHRCKCGHAPFRQAG